MKCVTIFLVLSFFVAVSTDPSPEVHRVTGQVRTHRHRIPASELKGGGGGRHVHRIPASELKGGGGGRHVHRIPASELEGGGGGRHVHHIPGHRTVHHVEGGGGGGGRHVHRIPGERKVHHHRVEGGGGNGGRHVHRVTGRVVTNKHSFKIPGGKGEGGNGAPEGSGPKGPGPKGPGSKGRGGPKGGEQGNTRCRKSGLTGLADKLNVALQGLVNKVADAGGANKPGSTGLIGHVLGGAQTGLENVIGGLDQGVSDFFCGFNRVFNKIGSQVADGNVLNAVLSGANVFVTGAGSFFGNLGTNAIGAITSTFSDLIHGRRSKGAHRIAHNHHGDLTDTVG